MRNIIRSIFVVAIISFVVPSIAFAWDESGHKTTAYIAWQRMTPEVREKVHKILMAAPEDSSIGMYFFNFGTRPLETKRREHFMLMAYWADIIRDRSFDNRFKKYHNSDWHYTNMFWSEKDGKAEAVDGMEPAGKALAKISEFSNLIRSNAPDAEKAVAIAWLEHLIGDVHQPLHISARVSETSEKGDQGGNLFFLTPKGTPREQQDNLHSLWDQILVRYQPNTDGACDANYIDPFGVEIMKKHPYEKLASRANVLDVDVWANESLKAAQDVAFKGLTFGEKPDAKYMKRAFELSQERIALAGYRMGNLFNEVFGTGPDGVSSNAIPCKIIRKVMYPITKTSSVKQTLEIAVLDLCPTQIASRPMYMFMIDGQMVMKEYDVIKVFKTEDEARKYAAENKITDISF